jgi:hypothetical protein
VVLLAGLGKKQRKAIAGSMATIPLNEPRVILATGRYTVLLPASAIPGWPADVLLPSDPAWK